VCLKPENVQQGSWAPRSTKEVFDKSFCSRDERDLQDDESSAERAFVGGDKATLALTVGMVVRVLLGL
jgi:hypothetical protein